MNPSNETLKAAHATETEMNVNSSSSLSCFFLTLADLVTFVLLKDELPLFVNSLRPVVRVDVLLCVLTRGGLEFESKSKHDIYIARY
jgi:hypothetical protein